MKDPGETLHGDHPGGLLLPYLEQMLSEEDQAMVEQHLHECDGCSQELQALNEMVAVLRNNKEALCPGPWELYEFSAEGRHQDRGIEKHLDACPSCSGEAVRYRSDVVPTQMSDRVFSARRKRFSDASSLDGKPGGGSKVVVLSHWLRSRSRRAVMTAVAMAAAAVLAIMIYPRGPMEPMFGLSSITWEQTGPLLEKSAPVFTTKPRVAVLLIFKDVQKPLPQDRIDALYDALKPTPDVADRVKVVKPLAVKNALSGKGIGAEDRDTVLEALSRDLDVSRVLLIVVTQTGDGFKITGEFVDTKSGDVFGKQTGHVSGEAELLSGMGRWLGLIQ